MDFKIFMFEANYLTLEVLESPLKGLKKLKSLKREGIIFYFSRGTSHSVYSYKGNHSFTEFTSLPLNSVSLNITVYCQMNIT